jgi:hypothetical protein
MGNKYGISLESIAMQSGQFFEMLVENITFLRNDGRYTTATIKESGIMETIRLQTGLAVDVNVRKEGGIGAYVLLPNVDRNHPFIRSEFRQFLNNDVGVSALNFKDVAPKGTVNTQTGKVTGWFTEVRTQMVLSYALMTADRITAQEVAAIILHELGHLFTYFLHLGSTVLSNLVVSAAARQIVGAKDYGEREYVLTEAERTLGIEIPNKEALAKITTDKEAKGVQTVMLTTLVEKARFETGFNIYEVRSCEQIADQFAVKHGAGVHLASALDKIYRQYGHRSYRNRMLHVMLEISKLVLFVVGLWIGMVIPLLLYVIHYNPLLKEYDDPKQRFEFIISTLTDDLKKRDLPEERRKQLVNDIEVVKNIAQNADDKRTINQIFWQYCRGEGSQAAKQEKLAKAIQEFTSSALFTSASKFALLETQ